MTRGGAMQQDRSHPAKQFTDTADLGLKLDIGSVFTVQIALQRKSELPASLNPESQVVADTMPSRASHSGCQDEYSPLG